MCGWFWLALSLFLVVLVVLVPKWREGFADFPDASLWVDKIPNRTPPPMVGYTGSVHYAPADLEANINKVKNDLANLIVNIPNDIQSAVIAQTEPIIKGALRQDYQCPLSDATYPRSGTAGT